MKKLLKITLILFSLIFPNSNIKEDSNIDRNHIPIVYNSKVKSIIQYYSKQGKSWMQKILDKEAEYKKIILPILFEKQLPPELFYITVIASGLSSDATSSNHKTAGIWQFTKSTAKSYGLKIDNLQDERFLDERLDIIKSTYAAADFLKDLYEKYDDWYLVLAAFHAGETRIDRHIKYFKTKNYWELKNLPKSTQNYIPSILALTIISNNPEKYGFRVEHNIKLGIDSLIEEAIELSNQSKTDSNEPNENKVVFKKHKIQKGESLWSIAIKYGSTITAICEVNKLNRNKPVRVGETITIPIGQYKSPPYKIYHKIKRGDTLSSIALKYRTTVSKIKKWNNINDTTRIKPGKKIVIYK